MLLPQLPRRSSIAAALPLALFVLAGCAGSGGGVGSNGASNGNSQSTLLPALSKVVRDADPLDITLGQPPSAKLLERFPLDGYSNDDRVAYASSMIVHAPSVDIHRVRVMPRDPALPVAAIEFTTVLEAGVDRAPLLADAGVVRGAFVGEWRGVFRPVKGELYGSHVYGLSETCNAYATNIAGLWWLDDSYGTLYGFVRAEDEAALLAVALSNTPSQVERSVDAALARGDVPSAERIVATFRERIGASFAPVIARVESAGSQRAVALGGEADGAFAAWRARFDARTEYDEVQLAALVAEVADLSWRFEGIAEAAHWDAEVRALVAPAAQRLGEREVWSFTGAAWLLYATDTSVEVRALGEALALAARLDALATAEDVVDDASELMFSTRDARISNAFRARWSAVAAGRHYVALGNVVKGPAVLALARAMSAQPQPGYPFYDFSRMQEAQLLDQALDDPSGSLNSISHHTRRLMGPLDGLNESDAWKQFKLEVPKIVRAELESRAARAREWNLTATAAGYEFAAVLVGRSRFPEPEPFLDVVLRGSQCGDPLLASARATVAELLVETLPAMHSNVAHVERFDQMLLRSPIVDWPAFSRLGLRLGSVAELRTAAIARVGGAEVPWVQLVSDGVDRWRFATVDVQPEPTMPDFALGLFGLVQPPDMQAESDWLAKEKAELDAWIARIDAAKTAHALASSDQAQRAQLFRDTYEERMKTEDLTQLKAEATALDTEARALNSQNEANNAEVRAYNERIAPFNERLARQNDRIYFLAGDQQQQFDAQLRDALQRWVVERTVIPPSPAADVYTERMLWTAAESGWRAWWLGKTDEYKLGSFDDGVAASRGFGEAQLEELERSLWLQPGAPAIGRQLGAAITLCVELDGGGFLRSTVANELERYRGRFGGNAVRDHVVNAQPYQHQAAIRALLPAGMIDGQ
jgi:hypothetical protein